MVYFTFATLRAQLQREKQAREDVERQKKDLEDRVKKFEDDAKVAQEGTLCLSTRCSDSDSLEHLSCKEI